MAKSKVSKQCINCNRVIKDEEGCVFLKGCTLGYTGIGVWQARSYYENEEHLPLRSVIMNNKRGCILCNECADTPLKVLTLMERIPHQDDSPPVGVSERVEITRFRYKTGY